MTTTTDLSADELTAAVAERVFGWRWWRYEWGIRDSNGGRVKATVRSLQPPEFPNEQWAAWGRQNGLTLADGSEPLHVPDGVTSTLLVDKLPAYATDIAAAFAVVAHVEGPDHRDCLSLTHRQGADSPFDRWRWAATFRISGAYGVGDTAAEAVCRAALAWAGTPEAI